MHTTRTIELATPVEFANKHYEKLELREPVGIEVVKARAENDAFKGDLLLISLISGVPRAAVERIPISVLMEASDYLSGFMKGPGPKTGES